MSAVLICWQLRVGEGRAGLLFPTVEMTRWDTPEEAWEAAQIVPCDADGTCTGDHAIVHRQHDFRQRERWRVRRAGNQKQRKGKR